MIDAVQRDIVAAVCRKDGPFGALKDVAIAARPTTTGDPGGET